MGGSPGDRLLYQLIDALTLEAKIYSIIINGLKKKNSSINTKASHVPTARLLASTSAD
jgi:hypothetical protein